ncbi:MAG: phosphoglucosamine mutase [Litorimonas sp.]
MAKFFGTDGVRGLANAGKMTPASMLRLGQVVGQYFGAETSGRPSALVGKDTRLSGDMIEAALIAGLTSVGVDVKRAGVLPTSGVSLMTKALGADLGVMITASHNKYPDNGVKFFGPEGWKLSDKAEADIEALLVKAGEGAVPSAELGRVSLSDGLQSRYIEHCKSSLPSSLNLDGLKIVIDAAHGAAFGTAAETFTQLGAKEVISIGASPTGNNINAGCGSTATELLSKTVISKGADVGVALDGDADRLIMCDEKGTIIDGDQLLGLLATSWKAQGRLRGDGIVATVMSNLGLERYLAANALTLIRTSVGDRHVVSRMRKDGYNVGGEQSGHILMTDYSQTGDGTMAAIQILSEIKRQNRPAGEVLKVFNPVPQILKNVRYSGENPMTLPELLAAIEIAQSDFAGQGRILIRASGTEPLIRVMAEGDDAKRVETVVDHFVDLIETLTAARPT